MLLCLEHGLRPVKHTKLFEDLVDMNLHRLLTDAQVVGNDFVGMTLRHQIKNFQLPWRQSVLFGVFNIRGGGRIPNPPQVGV